MGKQNAPAPPIDLVCVVCGGHHHPNDCDRARQYVAEIRQGTR